LEAMKNQNAMVAKLRTLQSLAVSSDQLDQHPFLVNTRNWTLDLSDGTVVARPHSQEDYLTKTLEVEYDPEATCPQWMEFLTDIFGGDEAIMQAVQRMVGYTLTGDTSEQCLFFAYGTGKNGKSVFFNALEALFGEYYGRAPSEMIMMNKYSQIPSDVAQLKGQRMVVTSEIGENRRLDEERIKDLTGGDTVTARKMHQDWFKFRCTHKLWIFGNHKPVLTGVDLGIRRRFRIIPFEVTIPEEKRRPMRDLLDAFRAELPGILNWALEGYVRYREAGLLDTEKMTSALSAYFSDMDIVGQFLKECCEEIPSQVTLVKKIWEPYKGWCDDIGERAQAGRRFNQSLRERGYDVRPGTGNKLYVYGLTLKMPES
jgi:putative DNA primase/helicase